MSLLGLHLVVTGDYYQLSPIPARPAAFSVPVWPDLRVFTLTTNHRVAASDVDLRALFAAIREGDASGESVWALICSRHVSALASEERPDEGVLHVFCRRRCAASQPGATRRGRRYVQCVCTRHSTRGHWYEFSRQECKACASSNCFNGARFDALSTAPAAYRTSIVRAGFKTYDEWTVRRKLSQVAELCERIIPFVVLLKVGAVVAFSVNCANIKCFTGDRGEVVETRAEAVHVRLFRDNSVVVVPMCEQDCEPVSPADANIPPTKLSFMPLRLCWAYVLVSRLPLLASLALTDQPRNRSTVYAACGKTLDDGVVVHLEDMHRQVYARIVLT